MGIEWKDVEETETINFIVLSAIGELAVTDLEAATGERCVPAKSNIASLKKKTADARLVLSCPAKSFVHPLLNDHLLEPDTPPQGDLP